MDGIKIKDNIYWVGALDPEMRVFDLIFETDHGTTYNSYLIKDEKTALIDTVKEPFTTEFISRVSSQIDLADIDYIIVSHTEPDHTGALPELLKYACNAKIIASKAGGHLLKNILNVPFNLTTIDECPDIDLGTCKLKFFPAPYLHWPDTIFTYLDREKILFTSDAFGAHYCDERMFDDLVGDFDPDFHYYYDCIMRPFKPYILNVIERIEKLDIDIIATAHGPIIRENPRKHIESYRRWSQTQTDAIKNVLILYVSIYGSTKKMAEAIAKGVSEESVNVKMLDVNSTDPQFIRDAIEKADGILVGTPTIVGDVPRPVWDALALLSTVKSGIKLGSAFGSYGWSGEAAKMVEDRLSGMHIKLHKPSFRVKLIPEDKTLKECREFGKKFVSALKQK
ncbi:MAG: FprA family A-type flavoprotein [Candidatus Scalindua rubra]|uniref:Putative flavoprotein n=1 Tax=Candidatus Scalindua brodae TaxID=237368 RepID=A0A0B0ENW6_9BACT|nr:MAG: putative flavoprotein [Candidatus Scalindua brodae]MBZ0107053.1 FprA family A-type flavoprotein [Candidatus Scalindua rubra]